jgi:hypothetical protein
MSGLEVAGGGQGPPRASEVMTMIMMMIMIMMTSNKHGNCVSSCDDEELVFLGTFFSPLSLFE